MMMTFNRLAAVAAAVLALVLVAGCGDQPASHANAGTNTHSSATEAAVERREVVLSVPGMDCPMCPITVRRALGNVDGVFEAEADLKTKQARATFDPARTDVAGLIAAVENAGFSASLQGGGDE